MIYANFYLVGVKLNRFQFEINDKLLHLKSDFFFHYVKKIIYILYRHIISKRNDNTLVY